MFINLQYLRKLPYLNRLERLTIDEDFTRECNREFINAVKKRLEEDEHEFFTSCEDIRIVLTMYLRSIDDPKASNIKVKPAEWKRINSREFEFSYIFSYKIDDEDIRYKTRIVARCTLQDNYWYEFCPESKIESLQSAKHLAQHLRSSGNYEYARLTRATLISNRLLDRGWEVKSEDYYKFDDNSFRLSFTLTKNAKEVHFDGVDFYPRCPLIDYRSESRLGTSDPTVNVYDFCEDLDCIAMGKKCVYSLRFRYYKDGHDYISYGILQTIKATIGDVIDEYRSNWRSKHRDDKDIEDNLPKGYHKTEIVRDDDLTVVAECTEKNILDFNNWKIL